VRFEGIARNCNTRLGKLEIEGKEILIPGILWYESSRIPSPEFAEIKLGVDIKAGGTFFYPKECKLCIPPALIYPYSFPEELHNRAHEVNEKFSGEISVISAKGGYRKGFMNVMANAKELINNPRNFVEAVVRIRERIGYSLLYAPGIANPVNLPILAYSGIDIFDSVDVVMKSRKGIYFTPEGEMRVEEMEERPCTCSACIKGIEGYDDLLTHNYNVFQNELIKVRNAIRHGTLRHLVEARSHFDANFATIIRLFDTLHYEFQEKRYPVAGEKVIASPYSLHRPDIVRFRKRVLERYEKPRCAKILLLLPCSAKKPYSLSKSHRLFRSVLANVPNRHVIHEVIVTSPLGIVPRELENVYPAAHYDISVTGEWYEEEVELIDHMLREYVRNNRYDVIISHLPSDISSTLEINAVTTCVDHPTSSESLQKLEREARIAGDFERVNHTLKRHENTLSMLKYQFGREAAENFLQECNVRGKFPEYSIYHEEKQMASFSKSRGMFILTFPGGKKLGRHYWVEIEDFQPKGSVFAVGVKDACNLIRVGDEVTVWHGDELRGVGIARMGGEEMMEMEAGEAVKIRHYR